MRVSEVVKVLEDIVSIPTYTIIGCTSKGLALYGMVDGVASIALLDPYKKSMKRVSKFSVAGIAEPFQGSDKIVYIRDVAVGAEKHEVREIDLNSYEDIRVIEDLPPMRIIGIAHDRKGIAFSAVTERDISIYYFERGRVEKVTSLPGMGFVTSLEDDIIVGSGSLRGDPKSMEIFVVSLDERELKVFTPKPGSVNKIPRLRNRKVYFESNATGPNRIMVLDLDSEEISSLEGSGDYREFSPREHIKIDIIDDKIVVIGKKEGRSKAFIDWIKVPSPEGTVSNLTLCEDSIYLSMTSMNVPSEVIRVPYDLRGFEVIYRSPMPDYLKDLLKGEVSFSYIRSSDGVQVPTFAIRKRDRMPTVVYVHGGPWSEVMDEWRPIIASLVATGFNVVIPNFRGSTGYGEDYRTMDIGDPGGGDLEDIVSVARWAVEKGIADEDRLYIMGYSYGGYMTLWATVSRPEVFKCGAAGAAISDWEEMYELSDAVFRRFIDILFAGRKELLRERSPVSKVENLRVPICIVQPQNDTRTPLMPILNFVKRLQELGKTFELHIVPDMGHVINTVEDAVKVLLPMLLFLKRCSK